MAPKQLYLHTSNRIERLAERLVEVSSQMPLSRPLAHETVMTLNPGMARWLNFEIARAVGVSFGWDFPLPAKLFSRILKGFDPDFDALGPFPEDLARWNLMSILSQLEDHQRFAQVRRYCQSQDGSRRFAFASRLTRIYDEYLVYRPAMITQWEDDPTASQYDWQAEIWRRLLRALYPNTKQPRHIARLWNDLGHGRILELSLKPDFWPERLFVFGVSSLAPLYLDLLDQLSHFRPVHIFLLQPSDLYWADLKTTKQIHKIAKKRSGKNAASISRPEDWLFETGNPLLPSFGKQGQMFLDLLIDKDPQQDDATFEPPQPERSQLACLQSDLFRIENRDLAKGSAQFPAYDGTLQVHSCSGKRREVETIWDLIVRRLDNDPRLKPSEILVMAPDIQAYRSHIEAVFKAKRGTSLEIPYSIADNSMNSRPGALSGLHAILQSVSSRASAADIIALLETPLLREVYSFSDQDLERIEAWIRTLGITWGWDAAHRGQHDSFATDRNTWKELRVRLLSGALFSQETPNPNGFLAYPEIEGELADTAGRLLECLELLRALRQGFHQTHSLDVWQSRLLSALAALHSNRDDWQQDYLSATELIRETIPNAPSLLATGSEAYRAVAEKLESTASGGGYLSGGVTFCSLKPMRAIPANTVCLMGMNRLDFPRRATRPSFDLLARESRIGDRNTRDEDRQFFLETLLSARSHVLITYEGVSPTSDESAEPSSVVEELLLYLQNAMPEGDFAKIQKKQKRQSFDPSYFEDNDFQTYDPARAKLRNRFNGLGDRVPTSPTPSLPDVPETDAIELETLIRFFKDPSKTFATTVAKLRLASSEDALVEMDNLIPRGLDRYTLRDTFAQCISRGESLDTLSAASLAQKKLLPPGLLETPTFSSERERAQRLADCLGDPQSRTEHCSIDVDGITIAGESITRNENGRQVLVHGGELKPKRIIDIWIRHLFALCANPSFSGETHALTLHEKGKPFAFGPVENPRAIIAALVQAYRSGQAAPIPFIPDLSYPCYTAWQKADTDSEEERIAIALDRARYLLNEGQRDDDFQRSFAWNAYDRVCFGDDFEPGAAFVEFAVAFWSPVESAKTPLKLETATGGRA